MAAEMLPAVRFPKIRGPVPIHGGGGPYIKDPTV